MSLLKQIKDDQLQARFNKDKLRAGLLTTLYSEAATIGKNAGRDTTDEEVVAVIRKFIKNINEMLKVIGDSDLGNASKQERSILENYLPEQISEEQLAETIDILVMGLENKTMKQMGTVMGELNRQYPGQFERAVASKIIQSRLS